LTRSLGQKERKEKPSMASWGRLGKSMSNRGIHQTLIQCRGKKKGEKVKPPPRAMRNKKNCKGKAKWLNRRIGSGHVHYHLTAYRGGKGGGTNAGAIAKCAFLKQGTPSVLALFARVDWKVRKTWMVTEKRGIEPLSEG